jgi:hypothetical protein
MIVIDAETVNDLVDWPVVIDAMKEGHGGARPERTMTRRGRAVHRETWLAGLIQNPVARLCKHGQTAFHLRRQPIAGPCISSALP